MPVTISGDGGIAGISSLGGGDFVAGSLTSSGDLIAGPQAVDRATLFVDDSDNSVSINTTVTPAAGVFLQVADATDPVVSLNNTGNGEVRLGCTAAGGYIGTESNHPFNIEINSSPAISVLANGNVGIGVTNPADKLEVLGDVRLIPPSGPNTLINFEYNNGTFAQIRGNGRNSTPLYGDIEFWTKNGSDAAPVERMVVRGEGRVGIGTTNPNYDLHVHDDAGSATIQLTNNIVGTASNAGARITASTSRTLYIENLENAPTIFTTNNIERMQINAGGNLSFPNGNGIDFSATEGSGATSSILDDYEEGTFTPTIAAGADDGSGGTVPYSIQAGRYTKVGNKVFVDIYIRFATGATSTSSHARIGNLPYNISNLSYGNVGAGNLTRGGGTSSFQNTTTDITTLYGTANTNFAYFYKNGGENFFFGGSDNTNLAGMYWIGYFTYNTDA